MTTEGNRIGKMDHSEYREEIPHGDHPLSYDHAEPRYRVICGLHGGHGRSACRSSGSASRAITNLIYTKEEYERVLSQDNWALRDLRNKEQWELTHYGYVDKS